MATQEGAPLGYPVDTSNANDKIRLKLGFSLSKTAPSFSRLIEGKKVLLAVRRFQSISSVCTEIEDVYRELVLDQLKSAVKSKPSESAVREVLGFTVSSFEDAQGYTIPKSQNLGELYPVEREINVAIEVSLELLYKSRFYVSVAFTAYPQLFEGCLGVPSTGNKMKVTLDATHIVSTRQLVESIIEQLPNKHIYEAAYSMSNLMNVVWGPPGTPNLDDKFNLQKLTDLVPQGTDLTDSAQGIPINALIGMQWVEVHLDPTDGNGFEKKSGRFGWYRKVMQFTNGKMLWQGSKQSRATEILTISDPLTAEIGGKQISTITVNWDTGGVMKEKQIRGPADKIKKFVQIWQNFKKLHALKKM